MYSQNVCKYFRKIPRLAAAGVGTPSKFSHILQLYNNDVISKEILDKANSMHNPDKNDINNCDSILFL